MAEHKRQPEGLHASSDPLLVWVPGDMAHPDFRSNRIKTHPGRSGFPNYWFLAHFRRSRLHGKYAFLDIDCRSISRNATSSCKVSTHSEGVSIRSMRYSIANVRSRLHCGLRPARISQQKTRTWLCTAVCKKLFDVCTFALD